MTRPEEDALVALYESRLAATDVDGAMVRLADAQQAKRHAQQALDELRRTLRVARAPFSPLPGDLLNDIFVWGNKLDPSPRPAFALAGVSRLWRETALGCGVLWSNITLDLGKVTNINSYLRLLLARSGASPLRVDLRRIPATWNYKSPVIEEALLLGLLRRSRELTVSFIYPRTLDIDENQTPFGDSLLPYLQTSMPLLEEFTCTESHLYLPDSGAAGARIFTLAPKLRKVDLGYFSVDLIVPGALPHLAHFRSSHAHRAQGIQTVSKGWPKLESLSIIGVRSVAATQDIKFTHLQELNCGRRGIPEDALSMLSPASEHTPNLRKLVVTEGSETELTRFLGSTSFASLHTLWIDAPKEFTHEFISVLAALPNLTEWKISDINDACFIRIWEIWVGVPEMARFASSLRTLIFAECDFSQKAAQLLVAWLQIRVDWARSEQDVGHITELQIVQTDKTITSVFPSWLKPRLEELVETVVLDTDAVQFWPEEQELSV
ncbi:hypothetical protein EXIGLDRAFT_837785 [Exidia glandulosa HHB12029]|uniref:F-box domain-containing protein n=1 Tax=Exidia glandulosa HHB12029 TaxID=1314781 RepID=A0A165GFR8_EXIGL|nr:hypothetical protein EXIGLDRAFT_837785 [Exidia glandulosa HHB12029]